MTEQGSDVTAAMHNVQDKNHIILPDSMDDEMVVSRETSQARK
jgi:hypothetical protein